MYAELLKQDGLLFWGGAMPAIHEHHLAYSLWQFFKTFETYTLDTSISGADTYWFYPNNFDFTTHTWKSDRAYLIEQPLEELRQAK